MSIVRLDGRESEFSLGRLGNEFEPHSHCEHICEVWGASDDLLHSNLRCDLARSILVDVQLSICVEFLDDLLLPSFHDAEIDFALLDRALKFDIALCFQILIEWLSSLVSPFFVCPSIQRGGPILESTTSEIPDDSPSYPILVEEYTTHRDIVPLGEFSHLVLVLESTTLVEDMVIDDFPPIPDGYRSSILALSRDISDDILLSRVRWIGEEVEDAVVLVELVRSVIILEVAVEEPLLRHLA